MSIKRFKKAFSWAVPRIGKNQALSSALRGMALDASIVHSMLKSYVLKQPVVHVVGDSHTAVFEGEKSFIVQRIGPATAYNLKSKVSSTNSNRRLFRVLNHMDITRDTVILVFGEIDCRIHIYNQYMRREKQTPIDELIEKTVSSYGVVLERIDEMGIRFYVYGVPPPSRDDTDTYGHQHYASPELRACINKRFNESLKEHCELHGYRFIDIHSVISDDEGFMVKEFSSDPIHLNKKVLGPIVDRMSF